MPGDRIEGGARRGDNLFHSFREFHVEEGRGVYFDDPGVENILSRVTGGVASEILGVLGVLGDANLFLINPSGIIFGDNARLDVSGSFVATTADAMQFGEQGLFSATDPTAPPLLTVQPSAFLFNQLNPAPIANNSTAPAAINPSGIPEFGLRVPAGESLMLLGGNVSINGGGLVALGGRVEIGGLSQPGTVTLNADGSLEFPVEVARADVSLTNRSRINVVGDGGSITVNAGELEILNSVLSAGIGRNSGFVGAQAGDITLNANAIRGGERAIIANPVRNGGVGNGGDIRITTGSLSLTNGAQLQAVTFGQGNAGNVIIHARDRVSLDGVDPTESRLPSAIFSSVGSINLDATAVGTGGDIRITTGSLSLTNGAQLIAGTVGQGDAGDVIIHARDRVSLNGEGPTDSNISSAIFSTVGAFNANTVAVGTGGDIRITTGSLSLTNGAELSASTRGQGDAGNVIIHARDRVSLEGRNSQGSPRGIFTATRTEAQGRGGDVRIAADSVRLAEEAIVSAETENRFSGGSITLNANTFEATGGGQVITSTNGSGRAGDITFNVTDRVTLTGTSPIRISVNQGTASGLFASTARGSAGEGGTIQITTGELQVSDHARVVVNSQGSGVAGNIDISAQSAQLDRGRLTAETIANDSGNITLRNLDLLQLSHNSLISTTAGTDRAGGDGGNINIDADLVVAFPNDNSDITANAFTGSGGNVDITTEGLFGIAAQLQENPLTNDITASSQQGVQGTVNITPPDVDPRRGLTELPVAVVDATEQITQICPGVGGRGETGEFVVSGRGGLPPSPIDALIGEESLADWSTLDEEGREAGEGGEDGEATSAIASSNQEEMAAGAIVEAQGWVVGEDGKVNLIATAPASSAQPLANCQSSETQ